LDVRLKYAFYLKSPINCIEDNFEVFDGTKKRYVPYQLFSQQKKLIRCYDKYRHNVVAKPRQAGISTTTAAYLAVKLALATKEQPIYIEILANKLDQSIEFASKIREFLKQIPIWMWGNNYNYNKKDEGYIIGKGAAKRFDLNNGSYVAAKPCTKDALRGTSPSYLVIDEAAFVENGKETYAAAAAATATGGKIILISTPNGMDELYYKAYVGALDGKNDFNIIKLHWALDPRYNIDLHWQKISLDDEVLEEFDEEDFTEKSILDKLEAGYKPTSTWFLQMCRDLNNDKRAIAQELEVQFQGSGGNVIDNNHIMWHEKNMIQDPILKEGFDKNVWIWQHPQDDKKYIAGVDSSTSEDKDYKTLSIIDSETYEVVLEYQGQPSDEVFSKIIYHYCTKYSAITVIDVTGGYSDLLVHLLEQLDFKFFYRDVKEKGSDLIETERVGYKIQNDRPAAISWFVSLVESRDLKCHSVRQINEWKTFVWKNGRADHQSGFNDDLIMSLVMPLWILEKIQGKLEKAKGYTKQMVNKYLSYKGKNTMTDQERMIEQAKQVYGEVAYRFMIR